DVRAGLVGREGARERRARGRDAGFEGLRPVDAAQVEVALFAQRLDGAGAGLRHDDPQVVDPLVGQAGADAGQRPDRHPGDTDELRTGRDLQLDDAVHRPGRGRQPLPLAPTAASTDSWIVNTLVRPVISSTFRIRRWVQTSARSPSWLRTRLRPPTRTPRPVESRNSTPSRSTRIERRPWSTNSMSCSRNWGAV